MILQFQQTLTEHWTRWTAFGRTRPQGGAPMPPASAPRSTVSDPLLLKITISFLLKPFSFFWPLSCDIEFNIYQNIAVGSYNFFWSISYLRQSRDTRSHPLLMRSHPAPTASHLRVFFWPMLLSSKIDTISKRGCYHLASKVGLFLHSEQIIWTSNGGKNSISLL